jgi:phage terminase large subunit-like protein
MERLAKKAMATPSATNNFLTKRLNVWVNADTAWMDMRAWEKCADPDLRIEELEGATCVVALDLASKVDVAAKIAAFERGGVYYAFGKYWLPEARAEGEDSEHYAGWAREGWITLTSGNVTDFDLIEQDVKEDVPRFGPEEICYDPWQAQHMANHLMAEGAPMVELRQTVGNLSEAMKTLEALVLQGRFRHNGDPVLAWMISNVVCHRDAKDNLYPRKENEAQKIDGAVALIMALSRLLLRESSTPGITVL